MPPDEAARCRGRGGAGGRGRAGCGGRAAGRASRLYDRRRRRPNPRCRRRRLPRKRDHDPRRKEAAPVLVQRHDAARRRDARARARPAGAAAGAHDALPEGACAPSPTTRRATSSSPARRRRGCSATSPRRADGRRRSASSTSARPAAGRPRRREATPKIAALLALAGLPEPDPVPSVSLPVGGAAADRRAGGRRAALGEACSRRSSRSPCSSPAARPVRSCRPSAQLPGVLGRASPGSPAGWAPSTSRGGRQIRSTSTFARAAMRASGPVPRMRSTGATRSISTAARPIAPAWPPAARPGRSTSRARTSRAASASTSCSTSRATPTLRMHQPPQGYLAPGRRPGRAGAGGGCPRGDGRRVREAEVLHLQGVDLRAQPVAEDRLQPVHRRLLDRGDPRRRRPRRRRAAPVHGLRRLRDRLSVGGDDVTRIRRCRTWAAACARCSPPTRRPAGATPASCCTPRAPTRPLSRLARRGRGLPGADDSAGSPPRRLGRARRLARGARARREPGRGPARRRRGAAVPRGAGAADAHRRRRSRRRWAIRASTSGCSTPAPTWGRSCASWPAALGVRVAGDVRADRRQAHHGGARDRAPAGARTGAAARDRAAGGRAVRRHRRRPRRVHDVPRLRRGLPGRARCWTTPRRRNCASSRASASSAGCAPRPAPSARSRWCRGSTSPGRRGSRGC